MIEFIIGIITNVISGIITPLVLKLIQKDKDTSENINRYNINIQITKLINNFEVSGFTSNATLLGLDDLIFKVGIIVIILAVLASVYIYIVPLFIFIYNFIAILLFYGLYKPNMKSVKYFYKMQIINFLTVLLSYVYYNPIINEGIRHFSIVLENGGLFVGVILIYIIHLFQIITLICIARYELNYCEEKITQKIIIINRLLLIIFILWLSEVKTHCFSNLIAYFIG